MVGGKKMTDRGNNRNGCETLTIDESDFDAMMMAL